MHYSTVYLPRLSLTGTLNVLRDQRRHVPTLPMRDHYGLTKVTSMFIGEYSSPIDSLPTFFQWRASDSVSAESAHRLPRHTH